MDFSDHDPSHYLGEDSVIDLSHNRVRDLFHELDDDQDDDVVFARRAFEHVRDVVRHSFDANDPRPSITASDAAVNSVGLCHAKSHLLVALLRSRNIPAGLCYQRIGTPKAGHAIHGLVALWLEGAWHRVDPRGNKDGIDAQFSLTAERLAWTVTPSQGEIDYPGIHVHPDPAVITAMRATDNILKIRLPESLPA